ncbi:MAG TPA: hypothetical protein VKY15_07100 [Acidimicrobiales bacterium]|nr:hypothetical protein [Acidimicrobiales bacterium]
MRWIWSRLARYGRRRALGAGGPAWLVVWAAAWALSRRRGGPRSVLVERLEPGQTLVVEHRGRPAGRRRRRSG